MVQISPYLRRFFEQFAMGFASTPKSAIFACDLEPSQNLRALANPSQNFRGQFRENFASSHKGSRLHHSQICEGLQIYFLQKLEKPFGVAFFATTHKTSLEPWQICEHSQTFSHNWSHLQVSRFGNFGQGERNIFLWEITHKEIYSASVFTLQEVISLSREKYSQEWTLHQDHFTLRLAAWLTRVAFFVTGRIFPFIFLHGPHCSCARWSMHLETDAGWFGVKRPQGLHPPAPSLLTGWTPPPPLMRVFPFPFKKKGRTNIQSQPAGV